MVDETIQQRAGEPLRPEDLGPLVEGQVGGTGWSPFGATRAAGGVSNLTPVQSRVTAGSPTGERRAPLVCPADWPIHGATATYKRCRCNWRHP